MRRTLITALAVAGAALAGCGGHSKACTPAPGHGTMGVCAPKAEKPVTALPPTAAGARLIPDVSEFQGCELHSEVIFRVYEAGTEREDANAGCHAREAKRLHVWFSVYSFLRPGHGGCAGQANRTVQIVRHLGGVVGAIVADAEVPLPPGFVRCFLAQVQRDGFEALEYTCPGCGDEQVGRIWIASYPTRPPGRWVAHQFSDNFPCRGIRGDCSVDEGILSIRTQPKPKPLTPHQKTAKLHALEHLLGAFNRRTNPHGHNCQHPPFKHAYPSARFNHACASWAGEVAALRKEGIR